jgi:hypothetical protein
VIHADGGAGCTPAGDPFDIGHGNVPLYEKFVEISLAHLPCICKRIAAICRIFSTHMHMFLKKVLQKAAK